MKRPFWMMLISLDCQRMKQKGVGLGAKLPQRVRIAVRRLHRAFGHVPKSVMVNLVRAAKVE